MVARYKLYRVDESRVLAMLNWNTHTKISLPVVEGIPAGSVVKAVNYMPDRMCFIVTVYHDSFDIVGDGGEIPMDNEWVGFEERSIDIEAYLIISNGIEAAEKLQRERIDPAERPSRLRKGYTSPYCKSHFSKIYLKKPS